MEDLVKREDGSYGVVNFEDYAMGVGSLVKQVKLIQDVMTEVMKDGEHYGVIPGTVKPTLLKPGAEKLCMVFRLEPDYEIIREFREDTFIAYTIKCTLKHIPSGQTIASGVGSCNSREDKYRWRYDETVTDQQVPKEYWAAKKDGNSKEMKRLLGEGKRTIKVDGVWWIANATKVENDNPWDLDNTIMKMACKRALVAATLNATAASDIFTQDVEDMPEKYLNQGKPGNGQPPPAPPQQKTQPTPAAPSQIVSLIEKVGKKAGKNPQGKDYTRYIVTANGADYSTFSETIGTDAIRAKDTGLMVKMTYKVGKFGNDIETLEIVELPGTEAEAAGA